MDLDAVEDKIAASLIGSILGEPVRGALAAECAWLSLPGGAILFEEGDAGDALYLLVAGALGVRVREDGIDTLIAEIRPGETTGEMALLSGEPRSATIVALRDSELLRLDKEDFNRVIARDPQAMLSLVAMLVRRLRRATHHERPKASPRTIAILPLGRAVPVGSVVRSLADELTAAGFRTELVDAGAAPRPTEWFAALEAEHDLVLYEAEATLSSWTRLCLRQADRILVLATEVPLGTDLSALLGGLAERSRPVDLALLEEPGRVPAPLPDLVGTALPIELVLRLRRGNPGDLARLGRLLTGTALGLVLSGGGARGFAHIGVIRALREARVPLDLVGGCSMGAIIAAGVAAEWSDAELEANIREAFVGSNPVNDYALPLLALVRGRKVESRLRRHFGEVHIEALWRPYFCVSSDLRSGRLVTHRSGLLWRALRASVAIPGLLPPVIEGDQVLADGGVINNLPIDVMRAMKRGKVLAADVASDRALASFAYHGESGSLWSLVRSGRRVPPIVDILVRAGTLTSETRSHEMRERADLVFDPPLERVDLLDWRAFDRAIEIGYRHAQVKLAEAGDTVPRLASSY
jgi:NTE family protein